MADDPTQAPSLEPRLLPDCPTDGITKLSYLPSSSLLASTSWDGCLRIHDTSDGSPNSSIAKFGQLKLQHAMDSGPLFSLAVTETTRSVVTGGMDGSIRLFDIDSSTPLLIGRHEIKQSITDTTTNTQVSCSCLSSLIGSTGGSHQLIASAGWHKQAHIWDTRQQNAVVTIVLPGKAYAMDVDRTTRSLLAIGTSNRRTCFVDIRYQPNQTTTIDTATMLLDRESSLKFPLRCLQFFPTGDAIAVGSIEGRVAVEYFDELGLNRNNSTNQNIDDSNGKKKFAFKCHRQGDLVYPVNCIEFHPRFGTFATGGCDGVVVLWDGLNKKKLTSLPRFATSIAALAFNHDGTELAIASSYTFEEGEREHPKDEIYVRTMLDSECRPKSK